MKSNVVSSTGDLLGAEENRAPVDEGEGRFRREERPLFERDNLLAFLDQGRAEARERQLIECELPVTRRTGRALRLVVASGITLCLLAAAVLTWMAVR